MNNVLPLKKKEPTWRKSGTVEETIGIDTRLIIILRYPGESDMDVQRKIDRWKSGEVIDDVIAGLPGGKEKVHVFRFEGLEPLKPEYQSPDTATTKHMSDTFVPERIRR